MNTPTSERLHIGIFGRRNAGKSTLANAITGQALSIVSETKGTTTDPVYKAMELQPAGPVVIIDTPGYDDEGDLGRLRRKKTYEALDRTDAAVVVIDETESPEDTEFLSEIKRRNIPWVKVIKERCSKVTARGTDDGQVETVVVDPFDKKDIDALKQAIARLCEDNAISAERKYLVRDLVRRGDIVMLVIPIDDAAPVGRIILPQQQVLREVLDAGGVAVAVKDHELAETLTVITPDLVITDSQVFGTVADILPEDIPLTSFSILMARRKGFLDQTLEAVRALDDLKPGDRILIAEGCTHHRQCDDIGTVKIPRWIKEYMKERMPEDGGRDSDEDLLLIDTSSGGEFPEDLSEYKMVIHCGGCMLGDAAVRTRAGRAEKQGIPFINYGILIAQLNGILDRAVEPLK